MRSYCFKDDFDEPCLLGSATANVVFEVCIKFVRESLARLQADNCWAALKYHCPSQARQREIPIVFLEDRFCPSILFANHFLPLLSSIDPFLLTRSPNVCI